MRIPLAVPYKINRFSGATIYELESGITNGMVNKVFDRTYVTQRPSIDVTADASATVSDQDGRGIYYWNLKTAKYFINYDTLYKNGYSTVISSGLTAGTDRCQILELGSALIILDPENNEGWSLNSSDTLSAISDADFPPNATHSATLCYGGAVLDGYVFVGDTDGNLYNSDNGSTTAWTSTSYQEAEREPDGGVYVGKHHDHIVFYGVRTTEFFYDASNASGSPLNRRQDIAYTIGCADGRSVWEAGDVHFLVGTDSPGARRVYKLQDFQLVEISPPDMSSLITQSIVKDSVLIQGSGFSANGKLFYIMTLYQLASHVVPYITLVYDDDNGIWYEWDTGINSMTKFPLMDWSIRSSGSRYGEGIFTNGDVFTLNDNFSPTDSSLTIKILADGIVEPGIVATIPGSSDTIAMSIRSGTTDFGSWDRKFPGPLSVIGDRTSISQTLSVSWSNEDSNSFNTAKSMDLSNFKRLNRTGYFHRRNHNLSITSTDQVRLEAIEYE